MLAHRLAAALAVLGIAVTACGGGGGSSSSAGAGAKAPSGQAAVDAKSAATGDIPDSQVYLTFRDNQAGYSIQYPEGWTQQGGGNDTRFVDKENTIHVVVAPGRPPPPAAVAAGVGRVAHASKATVPKAIVAKHGPALLVSYSIPGPADPVTGKVPVLAVDRYVYARSGRVATLDLASPTGVDNVDAYKLIGRGFQWR